MDDLISGIAICRGGVCHPYRQNMGGNRECAEMQVDACEEPRSLCAWSVFCACEETCAQANNQALGKRIMQNHEVV